MTPVNPLQLAIEIGRLLDELQIPYVVGGSVAASLFGEPRSTLDLDLMIGADEGQVRRLVKVLEGSCYVDLDTALDAVRERRSFNAIHLASSTKIDFFLAEDADFAREQLQRRRRVNVPEAGDFFAYTPEDLVIRKLLWFRLGNETSQRQWRDVVGILKAMSGRLDEDYLRKQAAALDLLPLFLRAAAESGLTAFER